MYAVTITRFLRVWENVFPNFLLYGVIFSFFLLGTSFIPLLYWRFRMVPRFQKRLEKNNLIFILTFKGWFWSYLVLDIYIILSSILFFPHITLFLILEFNLNVSILVWIITNLFLSIIFYYVLIIRWHFKFRSPKYYILTNDLGFNFFQIDLLLPFQSIIEFSVDPPNKMAFLVAPLSIFRFIPFFRNRKLKLYFQFATDQEFFTFNQRIQSKLSIKSHQKHLNRWLTRLFPIAYKSPQYLESSSLDTHLSSHTLDFISFANNRTKPSSEDLSVELPSSVDIAKFCYICGNPNKGETKFCIYCGTDLRLPLAKKPS